MMSAPPIEREPPRWLPAVIEATTSGLGGLAGYAIGSAPGAFVGNAAGPAAVAGLAGAIWLVQQQRIGRMDRVVAKMAAGLGIEVDQALNMLSQDERRAEMLGQALEAAARTTSESKIDMLARVLQVAASAGDTATVDRETLVLLALRDMEAPHIQVLERMSRSRWGQEAPRDNGVVVAAAWTARALAQEMPTHAEVIEPVLGVLASHRAIAAEEIDWNERNKAIGRAIHTSG